MRRFHFADASWFRIPLRTIVVLVGAFGLITLYPSLTLGSAPDQERAIFGIGVTTAFIGVAALFTSAINDSYLELDTTTLSVRFEGFFQTTVPLASIARVTPIDPRPRWRYRLGLSSDRRERISCSHGGQLLEIELERPQEMRIWPRSIYVRRLWLAVREYDAFVLALHRAAPRAFPAPDATPLAA